MFWKYNTLSTSQIDALLDRANAARAAKAAEVAAAAEAATVANEEKEEQPHAVEANAPDPAEAVVADAAVEEDQAVPTAATGDTTPAVAAAAPIAVVAPVTLKDILEQEEVIQECKNQNKKLVDYLCHSEILSELISLIVVEPSADLEDNLRFKLPHIAAEVLTCEVAQINEAISSDDKLLQQLYAFMEKDPPLNPLLASFFSRAFGVLITRKSEQNWYSYQYNCIQVFEFLKKKELVHDLLRHIGTSAISDLILRLITCVEGTDTKQNLLDWLNEKQLIQSIIGLLDPSLSRDTHDNASRLLIEILRVSRDGQFVPANERCDDPLLTTLEDPATLLLLLSVMFGGSSETPVVLSESSLVNGISVLLVLLESRRQQQLPVPTNIYSAAAYNAAVSGGSDPELSSPEEVEKQQKILDATIHAILPRMKDFTDLLVNPPPKPSVNTTAGLLDPPFGATRLAIAKLMSALLSTNSLDVNLSLKEHWTVDILLDHFFKYSLNNFLHAQVEQCLCHVFDWKATTPPRVNATTPPTVPTSPKNCSTSEETTTTEEDEEKMETVEVAETKAVAAAEEQMETTAQKEEEAEEEAAAEATKSSLPAYTNPLLVHLLSTSHLVDRVLDAWDDNDKPGSRRKGYMGHLTRIANVIVQHSEKTDCKELVLELLRALPVATGESWDKFVKGRLADTNAKNVIVPASSYANPMSSSEDDDADFRDLQFPQESALQQMQQMSEHFIDSFGFGAEEINDNEGENSATSKRFTTISFGMEEDEEGKANTSEAMFDAVCNQRTSAPDVDNEEEEEDMWADRTKEIEFGQTRKEDDDDEEGMNKNSSDEDDEEDKGRRRSQGEQKKVKRMDLDEEDPWANPENALLSSDDLNIGGGSSSSASVPIAMDTGNPWEEGSANPELTSSRAAAEEEGAAAAVASVPTSSTPPDGGWANFGEFGSAASTTTTTTTEKPEDAASDDNKENAAAAEPAKTSPEA